MNTREKAEHWLSGVGIRSTYAAGIEIVKQLLTEYAELRVDLEEAKEAINRMIDSEKLMQNHIDRLTEGRAEELKHAEEIAYNRGYAACQAAMVDDLK